MAASKTVEKKILIGSLVCLGIVCALVILANYPFYRSQDVKMSKAQLQCQALAHAAEQFRDHPQNQNRVWPKTIDELVHPPWGGPSFLKNEKEDLKDPCGNEFDMTLHRQEAGVELLVFSTKSPKEEPVSQWGIGKSATPPR